MSSFIRNAATFLRGAARFFGPRLLRHCETLAVVSGCAVSFSLYALVQLPFASEFIIAMLLGPLVTAIIAPRRAVIWGALTNTLFMLFFWFFPILSSQGMSGLLSDLRQSAFPILMTLVGVQLISLVTTVPVTLIHTLRTRHANRWERAEIQREEIRREQKPGSFSL